MCECPAVAKRRFSILRVNFPTSENLCETKIRDAVKFVIMIKCLEQESG
jgi:hypothetical protein